MRVLKITNRSKKPERTGSGVDLLARRRGLPEEVLEETRAEFLAQRATRLGSACRSLTRKGPAEHTRVRTRARAHTHAFPRGVCRLEAGPKDRAGVSVNVWDGVLGPRPPCPPRGRTSAPERPRCFRTRPALLPPAPRPVDSWSSPAARTRCRQTPRCAKPGGVPADHLCPRVHQTTAVGPQALPRH